MSSATLSPPRAAVCLTRGYVSRKIKGGTVIAEDVLDLQDHLDRLLDPDDYREVVGRCRRCGFEKLHAHSFRDRLLRPGAPEQPGERVTIRLFRCASDSCGAVFAVLPAFIARHLWRAWETVEAVCRDEAPAPPTTKRRWLHRLRSDATQLVQSFMSLVTTPVREVLVAAKPLRRFTFVLALTVFLPPTSPSFAMTASWIHRLEPGVRLM